MNSRLLKLHTKLSDEAMGVLRTTMERHRMSARAYDRILKVARTIADLDHADDIAPRHILEAVSYRNLDRSSWGQQINKLPFQSPQ